MKRYTLLIILALTSVMSHAQITIGGDVYGGGKEGAVNIGNTTATSATAKESVTLTNATSDATSVTITDEAVVRTVFGGGRNGRCYGQTNVSVDGGKIGATKWANTIHGGVFGAGDGSTAYVFGEENSVLIKGGIIVNNIYGGGNQADLMGCTKVTLQKGHFYGSVFGGARMANIYGHAFTLLDGENGPAATDSAMVIPAVYGGNDISGTIALSDKWEWTDADHVDISTIPIALRKSTVYNQNPTITNEWNAFVCSTYPLEDDGTTPDYDNNNIFVGNLYGAGNGDYTYTDGKVTLIDIPHENATYYTAEEAKTYNAALTGAVSTSDTNPSTSTYYTAEEAATYNASLTGAVKEGDIKSAEIAEVDSTYENLSKPDLGKTYLNLMGGTYGYVYGGGNNATVTGSTDILVWDMHLNNGTPYMASIPYSRIAGMDVLESMFDVDEDKTTATPKYQIDRLFGGNNKATMAISPEWYLAQGAFNNIYSGGNKGDMTAEDGLLLNIGSRSVYANNVYGGCRMADVHPQYQSGLDVGSDVTYISESGERSCMKVEYNNDGTYKDISNDRYTFANNSPARVYITEGHINNVYGGNDISGRVYLGTDVVIAGAISGNVYGGGNGSYAYTDNAELAKDPEYADLYYDGGADAASSIAALNAYRPHVDNTVLNIFGNDEQIPSIDSKGNITVSASNAKPVIVTGGVYCGGNSATIENTSGNPSATFKIGKNAIINAVYLGSNGENMITEDILKTHAGSVTVGGNDYDYSKFDLTDKTTFDTYMKGCAVNIRPTVTYDWDEDEDPHTFIGSLYGGGNVGSVTYPDPITIDMPAGLVIYDRVVGGCRAADVDKSDYNAAFEGGVIKANSEANKSVPKVTINMSSYLEPRELWPTMKNGFLETALLYWDVRNYYGQKYDSTNKTYATDKTSVFVDDAGKEVSYASVPWLPYGANVFGGCYTSGHIAGDVQINVTRDIVSNTMIHHDADMSASVHTPSNASINWVHLGEYVFAQTMSIYGGGYGAKTYIAGDTHINLSGAARVINVLGGADYGTVGCAAKYDDDNTLLHAAHTGSTHVTVATGMTDYSKVDTGNGVDAYDTHLPYNVTKIYGGAYAGTIYGHTELRLNGGSYQQAYGGSCNADIADYASLYLGATGTANSGYPYVYLYAFGGNDFGGYIGRDGKDNTKTDLLVKDKGFADGDILGYHDFTGTQAGYNSKTIRTTRYVEYNSGRIGYQYDASKGAFDEATGTGNFLSQAGSQRSSIYGGSYGSYDYSLKYASWDYVKERMTSATAGTIVSYDFDPADASDESKFHYPLMKEYIPTSSGVFCTNTYVNVPCASTDVNNDVIQRGIFGGGRGMTQTGIVDASQTYVYLHGAKWGARNANLSYDIYGGGYYSIVDNTKVDAESGCTNIIYGGSYGTSAKNLNTDALKDIHYNSTRTEVNMYDGMDNSNMSIFGGGGFAGATDTYVNLYGGMAQNVYGGSYNEGYCKTTHVNVPDATNTVTTKASTASVNAIFGGGYGNDVTMPCDEGQTNVTFSSATAYVTGGVIYGGNNAKRAAAHTNVVINTPVKTGANGTYVSVCGAGNGSCSVAGFTNVTLNNTAYVNNVYGGGRDGKVFGYYKNINPAAHLYYDTDETYQDDPTNSHPRHGYAGWKYDNANNSDGSWEGTSLYETETPASGSDLFGYYTKSTVNGKDVYTACYSGTTADGSTVYYKKLSSTTITVNKGATAQNVYGGGYGADATVAGSTRAHNHGGTIVGNLFGGGFSGNVVYQNVEEKATDNTVSPAVEVTLVKKESSTQKSLNSAQVGNIYTYACNHGGSVTTIYGGGYNGQVGSYHEGVTYTFVDGSTVAGGSYPAESRVEIGEEDQTDYYVGQPIVLRSVYGGGYKGAIYGTAKIQMLNGYIGYSYDASATDNAATTFDEHYVENLNVENDERELLKESGNIFGGGFGEGATTDKTIVNMMGGTIRNSVYGGGEIASVGVAVDINMTNRAQIPHITVAGHTQVNMYGGLVTNNVFGGGRGYAIDDVGNMATGDVGYSDGYTFGQTEVNVYHGTIGTTLSVAAGNGNVFGGGNIGYVYGGANDITNGSYHNSYKQSSGDKYYHKTSTGTNDMTEDSKVVVAARCRVISDDGVTINGHTYAKGDYVLTTDLNTLKNTYDVTNGEVDYWSKLDNLGINIGNAVFAGGNVSSGSDKVYANTYTIYGNATASVEDVLNKDFITIGDDGIGGLYGDGNLTFVDGYRELNITNYGTDYYNLNNSVTLEEYKKLTDRERAYFELLYESKSQHTYTYYTCLETHTFDNVIYKKNQKLSSFPSSFTDEEKKNWSTTTSSRNYAAEQTVDESTWSLFDATEQANWEQKGFCTLYAGRMMNTIQRADFCGIFGSRLVMKGAQDRVPSVVDYTDYTINRVGEISLNQACKSSLNPSTDDTSRSNYFGIYSVVNYLGALTSDITLDQARTTTNETAGYKDAVNDVAYGTATYRQWKQAHLNDRKRNNGSSRNEVALASGVWLEIVKEKAASNYTDATDGFVYKTGDKVYGPITGVVELNLINAATGEGGGYVYAKNIHGTRGDSGNSQVTLSGSNANARSYKLYSYSKLEADASGEYKMESSGNFVNSLKRIIDDCYPKSGAYYGSSAATAHYWYIRGEYYVYDQYISAYTGSSQPYAKNISIPLTITPEARGRLSLNSIEKNHYAHWTLSDSELGTYKSSSENNAIVVNGVTYHQNDPISDWDWSLLTDYEKSTFFTARNVETYACTKAINCTVNNKTYKYAVGDMLMPTEYDALSNDIYVCTDEYKDANNATVSVNSTITKATYDGFASDETTKKYQAYYMPLKDFFHLSNAISSDNGFLLTFDWDNPEVWDDYYKKITPTTTTEAKPIMASAYDNLETTDKALYTTSPSFSCTTGGVYGQTEYKLGEVVDQIEYQAEEALGDSKPDGQAEFSVAYAARETMEIGGTYYVKGACINATTYNALTDKSNFGLAYICTETYQSATGESYVNGTILTQAEYTALGSAATSNFKPAYICTTAGLWGGTAFATGKNYRAIDICNLSSTERAKFKYNYDALDLLSENFVPTESDMTPYQGNKTVDGSLVIPTANQIPYAEEQSIDYTAVYTGTDALDLKGKTITLKNGDTKTSLTNGDELTNTVYENDLVNEQFNYTPFIVTGEKYRLSADATIGGVAYAAGSYITESQYQSLEDKTVATSYDVPYYVVKSNFRNGNTWYCVGNTLSESVYSALSTDQKSNVSVITSSSLGSHDTQTKYYFCTSNYTAQTTVTDLINDKTSYAANASIPVGTVISETNYGNLTNQQKNFSINGEIPNETSTLYVARETDIDKLSKDRIVTVTYWYQYIESDETGSSYETIRERHIVNVHIHFESGVPTIGELLDPSVVLPGTAVAMSQPSVSKGAYEILGGGWEIYNNQTDAEAHKNGDEYTNNATKLYYYQDGSYIAYYAKSYLGKTYSNSVKITVANYHRMEDVMTSKHDVYTTTTNADGTQTTTKSGTVNDYMYLDKAKEKGKDNPKVYINDHTCTDANKTELNYLADFYNATQTNPDDFKHVPNCANIEFILQSDVTPNGSWTPIGNAPDGDGAHCFAGNFHGDGHTLSGMDHSLFNYFCGNIYNTGVTGTFTGAGVADHGEGNATNCWTTTTGTIAADTYPIFGAGGGIVTNCYHYDQNKYATNRATSPVAMPTDWKCYDKPLKSFVDGEVAFNLNRYYLNTRKSIHDNSGTVTNHYYKLNASGTIEQTYNATIGADENKRYDVEYAAEDAPFGSSGNKRGYVEERYYNGDFIYEDGTIPRTKNIRLYTDDTYCPVYPDDYIYFGQKLTYGILSGTAADSHVDQPEAVNRVTNADDESLNTKLLDTDIKTANRVYRSPAYYKSKVMSTAYFNKPAAFKDSYTLSTGNIYGSTAAETVYKDLTAIDFTGYNDFLGKSSYTLGTSQAAFYKPLLDYDGITAFATRDITRNLLVYDDPANDATSYGVLETALPEATLTISTEGYRSVAIPTTEGHKAADVKGHLVDKTADGYTASRNHFLVDKEVFNCPISYDFDSSHKMWYQRTPANYVDASKGWEAISLPFTADLVSTPNKGEITHFYKKSDTDEYTKGYDSGHEYWLRKYTGIAKTEINAEGKNLAYSTFAYPTADKNADEKVDANVFLWDYYYSHDDNSADAVDKDANGDSYPSTDASTYLYYKDSRTYPNYPLYTVAVPYIVGFPGSRYYEFDMSGSFEAKNRSAIDKLDAQVISFVSVANATIAVSDDELAVVENGGYSYVPNYMNNTLTADNHFTLNSTGSAFEKVETATAAVPFRPYFEKTANPAKNGTRSVDADGCDAIYITGVDFNKGIEDSEELTGELNIYAKKGVIVVESGMSKDTFVTIHTVGGALLKAFYIAPGEKKETSVPENVIYLVNKKKVFVK